MTLKVIVARIIIDSFIERQGLLRPGDLILEANGERVGSFLSSEGHFPFWPFNASNTPGAQSGAASVGD